jgi:peptidoglycan/LPS O-acetylase OafA/YrhL
MRAARSARAWARRSPPARSRYCTFRASGMRDALLEWSYELLGRSFVNRELAWSNEFVAAYCIGLLVAANFIGVHAMSARLAPWFAAGERPIRACAGYTFSIYLLHYPLLQFIKAALPLDARSPVHILVLLLATLLGCCAIGHYTERRKHVARAGILAVVAWGRAWRRRAVDGPA